MLREQRGAAALETPDPHDAQEVSPVTLLHRIALAALAALAFAGAADAAPSTFDADTYDAFGIIDRSPISGQTVMVYRSGAKHSPTVGDVINMRTSADNGATFTEPLVIASFPGHALNGVSGGYTPTGRLVIFHDRWNERTVDFGYTYSDDDGKTWSPYKTLSHAPNTDLQWYGPLVAIGGGRLMQSWYGWVGSTFGTYVLFSNDNGATWGGQVTVTEKGQPTEASYAYLGNNRIVGLIRHNDRTAFEQVLSMDNGRTWVSQGDTTFDVWPMSGETGTPPWLRSYRDHLGQRRVACYYANRIDQKIRVTSATASALLARGAAAWTAPTDIATTVGNLSRMGYPTVVQDGEAAVGWYYDEGPDDREFGPTKLKLFTVAGPTRTAWEAALAARSAGLNALYGIA